MRRAGKDPERKVFVPTLLWLGINESGTREWNWTVYDAGFAYVVSRDVQVDVSVGARGIGYAPPPSILAAGVSVKF